MNSDNPMFIDPDDIITIKRVAFRGTQWLWEVSTRRILNTEVVNKAELKTYKKILIMANDRLNIYQPVDNINITRRNKFIFAIATLFAKPNGRGVESALRRICLKY